jgi:pilus assembly protein Flp/PilA
MTVGRIIRALEMDLAKLFRDEEGATAVEYGLIVAAIAGVIIVVVFLLGNKISNQFNNVANKIGP